MVKKKQERRFQHERQPLLPLRAVDSEANKRDAARETTEPEQLSLLPDPQLSLFDED